MNRRKFITSGAMGAAFLSVLPSYALTSNTSLTLSSLGKGFKTLSKKAQSTSVLNLSKGIKNTHNELMKKVDKLGYIYNEKTIVKLNENSYVVPLLKKSFLGVETKEMALIVEGNYKSKFYFLNEKLTNEFDTLICNFNKNKESHAIDVDASDFSFPVKVLKQTTTGKESCFEYKNKFNATIKLYNNKTKSKVYIS